MKLRTILTGLVLASTLVFTACQNTFSGTTLDTSALTTYNSANNTTTTGVLQAPVLSGTLTNYKNQLLTLEFGSGLSSGEYPMIDASSVASAITINYLSNASDDYTPYVVTTAVPYVVNYVSASTVVLDLDLSTGATSQIQIFIDGSVLTGRNGTLKMDLDDINGDGVSDGDDVQGEDIDDDVYDYYTVGRSALASVDPTTVDTGAERNPRLGMSISSGGFIIDSGTTTNGFELYYDRIYTTAYDTFNYSSIFANCLVIEKYAPASNTWATVTLSSGSYNSTNGYYTVTFPSAAEGDVYRAKLINRSILVTNGSYYGFTQKYSSDNKNLPYQEIIAGPTEAYITTTRTQLLTGEQESAFGVSVLSDTNGYNAVVRVDLDLTVVGNNGLDLATLSNNTLKFLLERTGGGYTVMDYVSYSRLYTNILYPAVPNVLLFKLDPTYKVTTSTVYYILVNQSLKTLQDSSGTPAVRHFGSSTRYIYSNPSLVGWYDIKSDGSRL